MHLIFEHIPGALTCAALYILDVNFLQCVFAVIATIALHTDMQEAMLRGGCIQAVLATMQHHNDNMKMQQSWGVLQNMCNHQVSAAAIVQCGGIPAIVHAMHVGIDDSETQCHRCLALTQLFRKDYGT